MSNINTPKRRKWDKKYLSLGFFIPQRQSSFSGDEFAQCMFCTTKFSSNGWVPSKLQRHLESQHNEHVKKSEQFFKNYYKNNFYLEKLILPRRENTAQEIEAHASRKESSANN